MPFLRLPSPLIRPYFSCQWFKSAVHKRLAREHLMDEVDMTSLPRYQESMRSSLDPQPPQRQYVEESNRDTCEASCSNPSNKTGKCSNPNNHKAGDPLSQWTLGYAPKLQMPSRCSGCQVDKCPTEPRCAERNLFDFQVSKPAHHPPALKGIYSKPKVPNPNFSDSSVLFFSDGLLQPPWREHGPSPFGLRRRSAR